MLALSLFCSTELLLATLETQRGIGLLGQTFVAPYGNHFDWSLADTFQGVLSLAQVGAGRLQSHRWFCPPLITVKSRRVEIIVAVI